MLALNWGRMIGAVLGSLLFFTLVACSGDSGQPGAEGPPGPSGPIGQPGPPGAGAAGPVPTALTVTITDVTIASKPVVEFMVVDQDGYAFPNLPQASFTIVKLVPGVAGGSTVWQSYINRTQAAGTGPWPGTVSTIQATAENSNSGVLENRGDGTYRYTFATDVSAVTAPLAVTFEPELTHRVGMQVSGSFRGQPLPAANAVYTFQPSTGLTVDDGIANRKMVTQQSCNACHGNDLALHGGGRIDVDYCVTCHNPGTIDAQSGHTVDFAVMVHKIHMGKDLPSVKAGNDYIIYGFGNSPHNFSDVAFPQDIRNCVTCHDPENEATPQAVNISHPTVQACGSCHDDIDFVSGENHPPAVNGECSICHRAGSVAGDVMARHAIPRKVAAQRFQFNILEITNTARGEMPTITFSVTDPTNNNAPYNVLTDPEFGTGSGMALRIGWNTKDYVHGPGAGMSVANIHRNSTANPDGSFTITAASAIPATAVGSGVVGIEGRAVHPEQGFQIPVTGAVEYFAITDSAPVPRRQVVSVENCQACHSNNDALSFHGSQRTDEVQLCMVCHNPNTTDVARRGGATMVDGVSVLDGLPEQSIHFKYMIHAIHGTDVRDEPFVVYGFGNSAHDFSNLRYPRKSSDCMACHTGNSYQLPLPNGVRGTSVATLGTPANPAAHLKISEATAACASCHTSELAKTHMFLNGGVFDHTQEVLNTSVVETCSVCHGPGQIADVKRVHGLQ